MHTETKLKRSITLPFLILYGLGTMIGGGFYALLGKVAGETGMYLPIALLLSGALALVTSFSFAELSSRYPVSAGESRYVKEAFNNQSLATIVGWLVILTGIVSAAALSVATIGFLQDYFQISDKLGITLLVISMGLIAAWGIGKSVAVVTVITIIEVGALIYASIVADANISQVFSQWRLYIPPMDAQVWIGVFSGSFLAFYAFIGFEDMVNMAEEVKDVRKVLPAAIIISVLLTIFFYMLVGTIAVSSVSPDQLAQSNTPIAELVHGQGKYAGLGLWAVSLLTGLNGALVQIIMASRVAYGLANSDQAPKWLSYVHPKTQTPLRATILIMLLVLLLALFFPLTALAKLTSFIIILVFTSVNFSLWRIKKIMPDLDGQGPRYPNWVPLLGTIFCVSVLVFQTVLLITV